MPGRQPSPRWAAPAWTVPQGLLLVLCGVVAIAVWGRVGAQSPVWSASGGPAIEAAAAAAGRHFVVVAGGGDTAYLAVGTTETTVPAGTLVSFEPGGLATSLGGVCARWDLMARFGGRTVGDTRLVAGTWTDGAASVDGAPAWVATRPEPMTWYAACYDLAGLPVALPPFTAHIEFVTAAPFS